MNRLTKIVIVLFFFSESISASECLSKKTNDPDIFICAENNRIFAEKELNQEYAEAKKRINETFSDQVNVKKEYLSFFLEAQRGWLVYRDNQCKMFAHVADRNSSPYTVFTNNCIAKLDEERTKELKEIPYD